MMTVPIPLSERVVHKVTGEAIAHGMSFPEYVEWRLSTVWEDSGEEQSPPIQQSAAETAREIFLFALDQPVHSISQESDMESNDYLVETLYKKMPFSTDWGVLDRGFRIMIGKAFKREVDGQSNGGTLIDEENGYAMKVKPVGRSPQNQAIYKTVRAA